MEIVDFRPELAGAFKALNEAWITTLFALEPKDEMVLGDPAGQVVAKGGRVLFAVENGEAVGCCALMALSDGGFELAKMAVSDACKGRGLGRALMAAAVERAKAAGAPASTWRPTPASPRRSPSTAASGSGRSSPKRPRRTHALT